MVKKLIAILTFAAIVAIGLFQKNELLYLVKEGGFISILISILAVAICVFFPVIPFPILAGTFGAVFGVIQGVFISLSGAMAGTMCFFFLSRYGFRDFAQSKLMNYPKVQEYEQFLNRNSFMAVLACRLIPVIPAPVVNMVCGLSRVQPSIFFAASTIGKIPNILLLSFAGDLFTTKKLYSFGLYGAYLLILVIANFVVIYRRISKD
jgi:uncharacterized membrane protein YdjX (TVP38/TMEM64 family)